MRQSDRRVVGSPELLTGEKRSRPFFGPFSAAFEQGERNVPALGTVWRLRAQVDRLR